MMKKGSRNKAQVNNNNYPDSGDVHNKGRTSPADSGIDTHEWDESYKGPRMSLDPYNYGGESEWSRVGNKDRSKGSPSPDKRKSMLNGVDNGSPRLEKGKGPVKAASQFIAKTNFLLEHLASFTSKTPRDLQITPQARLNETKQMLANGTLWTKDMEMRLTDNDVVLLDGETQDVIEVYPLSNIGQVQHISDDQDLNNVLVFSTMQTEEKYAAMHIFQSEKLPATVIATEIVKASSSKEAMPHPYTGKMGGMLPPPPSQPAPQPPKEIMQERMDLHEKSLVAQTIAAFSAVSVQGDKKKSTRVQSGAGRNSFPESEALEESVSIETLEARINRDVQILNHCIDDVEQLVLRIKASAEAWKKLQKKKKVRADHPLMLEAKPPAESDLVDAFQKFKYAFNLLGKLRQHLHKPNAAELVHYLFVPLAFLIKVTNGPHKAWSVVSPLLTTHAVELLQNCLSSQESDMWQSLGPKWTQTKHSKNFKDQFVPPYAPVFKDGWVPPGIVGGKDVSNLSAAVAANAAAVAQLKEGQRKGDELSNPSVLAAAAKFKRLASVNKSECTKASSPKFFKRVKVMHDFTARNSKELSAKQGEELTVLDDSRQWWCVRNTEGTIGFVPHTIVGEGNKVDKGADVVIPSPPTSPPPQVPVHLVSVSSTKIVTSKTDAPPPTATKTASVELRHVQSRRSPAEDYRRLSSPKEKLAVSPPPMINTPPSTTPPATPPPPTYAPPAPPVEETKAVKAAPQGDLAQAILSKNLRKVDQQAEKKRKDEAQQKRMSSADLLNDELKRRMTNGQGGLTPSFTRKDVMGPNVNLDSDSSPDDVKEWLLSKGFSQSCAAALSPRSAKDLESMNKDDFRRVCGESEGARVFSQFSVQKANWEISTKGSELKFIMQRRKERVDDKQLDDTEGNFNLRNIVAEAKVAAAQEEIQSKRERTNSAGKVTTANVLGPPPTRARPKSMVEVPRTQTKNAVLNRTSNLTERKTSFGTSGFVPPPPMLYHEGNEAYGTAQNEALTTDTAEMIIEEQRKQQQLLMEHQKQLALLERLERQKLELDQQKREFEAQQQKQQQAMLLEKQKELERQINSQQEQLKSNEERLEQQKAFMNNFNMVQPQFRFPGVSSQVPMMSIPTTQPVYVPSMGAGMQPMYGGYSAAAMMQAAMPQMIPGVVPVPSTLNQNVHAANIHQG